MSPIFSVYATDRGIDENHLTNTMTAFWKSVYDPRIWLITFTIHKDDVMDDSDSRALIVTPFESNGQQTLKEGVCALILGVHYRYEAIL